jgi:hypothetical protein
VKEYAKYNQDIKMAILLQPSANVEYLETKEPAQKQVNKTVENKTIASKQKPAEEKKIAESKEDIHSFKYYYKVSKDIIKKSGNVGELTALCTKLKQQLSNEEICAVAQQVSDQLVETSNVNAQKIANISAVLPHFAANMSMSQAAYKYCHTAEAYRDDSHLSIGDKTFIIDRIVRDILFGAQNDIDNDPIWIDNNNVSECYKCYVDWYSSVLNNDSHN